MNHFSISKKIKERGIGSVIMVYGGTDDTRDSFVEYIMRSLRKEGVIRECVLKNKYDAQKTCAFIAEQKQIIENIDRDRTIEDRKREKIRNSAIVLLKDITEDVLDQHILKDIFVNGSIYKTGLLISSIVGMKGKDFHWTNADFAIILPIRNIVCLRNFYTRHCGNGLFDSYTDFSDNCERQRITKNFMMIDNSKRWDRPREAVGENVMFVPLQLSDNAIVTWNFKNEYFLETSKGNFIYEANTIIKTPLSYDGWSSNVNFVKKLGTHVIGKICSSNASIMEIP
jgi:hypothetical protein